MNYCPTPVIMKVNVLHIYPDTNIEKIVQNVISHHSLIELSKKFSVKERTKYQANNMGV